MTNQSRVLVVDDDANLRKTLSDILRVKGFEVFVAGTGAEGVAEAARTNAPVALIDLKLPDMSGIEVMERIKRASPLTEAIILTGHAALESAIEATNKGAYSYLVKPYEIDELLQHVRHAVERQRSQQEIVRLASFAEMDPNPVMEVDASGQVTYLNPAAQRLFPSGTAAGPDGALGDIRPATGGAERKEAVREIQIGDAIFQQFLYPVPHSELTRIYLLDITTRKAHEAKLNRLNLLLNSIRSVNEYLLVAKTEEALFGYVCDTLKGVEDIVCVAVAVPQPDYLLKTVACAGPAAEAASALDIRADAAGTDAGIMGAALREGKPLIVADIEADARFAPAQEALRNWQARSAAAMPLTANGQSLGVLAVYSRRRNAFDAETTQLLAGVANDVAIGVRAKRLDHKLDSTLTNLRKSLYGTVEAVARMVELRDPYTAGHERRVSELAFAIGKELGLRERQVEGLRVTGFLHDIGKIAVPSEILSKPSKLTDIELAMVKSHPEIGYDILKGLQFPWPVAEAVLQHHERLDGSGYPRGLKGPDIILEARVLMVADVVEAMATHRPYRASLGLEPALEEIGLNKGKLYDPDVVDACVRLFAEKRFVLNGEH